MVFFSFSAAVLFLLAIKADLLPHYYINNYNTFLVRIGDEEKHEAKPHVLLTRHAWRLVHDSGTLELL